MKKCITYLAIIGVLLSCATKIPTNYFNSESKIGLIIVTNPIEHFGHSSSGGFGLAGALVSVALQPSGDKYKEPFKVIGPGLNPTEKIKTLYSDIFAAKNKKLLVIDDTFDIKTLNEFEKPKTGKKKKYFKRDLRYLKEKHQIDELLIVLVRYGVYSRYSYGIETVRNGATYISAQTIDLNDNSIIFNDWSSSQAEIFGPWKTPAYENLKNAIYRSIVDAIAKEKVKYK